MAEDRTPRIVSLTQPLEEPPRKPRRRIVEHTQEHHRLGPEQARVEPHGSDELPGTGPDDIHPPSLA